MFEIQKSGDKTSSGEIGLDIVYMYMRFAKPQCSSNVLFTLWEIRNSKQKKSWNLIPLNNDAKNIRPIDATSFPHSDLGFYTCSYHLVLSMIYNHLHWLQVCHTLYFEWKLVLISCYFNHHYTLRTESNRSVLTSKGTSIWFWHGGLDLFKNTYSYM